jgi:hypothetical protein
MQDPISGFSNAPRGTLPLDAARSAFSSADTGVKTRELVGTQDSVRVIARGVKLVNLC